jgi:hypothetical protein
MRRLITLSAVVAVLALAAAAHAECGATKPASAGAKAAPAAAAKAPAASMLKGELVDTGCYIGHEAKGEKHISCASKCIANGMPMGILTADGTLYLITRDHDITDPYEAAKKMAGMQVEATGTLAERGGMKSIDLTAIKLAAAK